jgi:hypothetical protein
MVTFSDRASLTITSREWARRARYSRAAPRGGPNRGVSRRGARSGRDGAAAEPACRSRWSSPGLMLSLSSDGPANAPRPEKSGAKVRFLVDPTIGWRRHEWGFRVERRPSRLAEKGRSSGMARCQQHTDGVVHFAGVQRPDPDCCRPRTARLSLVPLTAATPQQPRFCLGFQHAQPQHEPPQQRHSRPATECAACHHVRC